MSGWLPEADIAYRWEAELGGRRSPREDSPHLALRNDGFRAYADHMETEPFTAALDDVVEEASGSAIAVLCAEGCGGTATPPARRCPGAAAGDPGGASAARRADHAARADRGRAPDGDRLVYDVGITPPLSGLSALAAPWRRSRSRCARCGADHGR